jgi:pimeloyl-ACP methyl ester carboxylesterase
MPRTVADFADDAAAVCDHLGIGEFATLGWSAGGPFALACAARLPERVTRVATLEGMAPLRDPLRVRELGLLADRFLFPASRRVPPVATATLWASQLGSDESLKRRLVRSLPSPSDRAVVGAQPAAVAVAPWRHATAQGSRGLVDDYAVTGSPWTFALHHVRRPVTVFQGTQDTFVPRLHAEALAARLGDARLELVEGAGHFVFHVATERVLASLAS